MEIVVRLRSDTAEAFRAHASEDPALKRIEAVLGDARAMMTPQFPEVVDPEQQRYFTVSGLPDAEGERIAAALLELDEVEAAYAQPPPSPA
jgi:hypothetical protein